MRPKKALFVPEALPDVGSGELDSMHTPVRPNRPSFGLFYDSVAAARAFSASSGLLKSKIHFLNNQAILAANKMEKAVCCTY
jgi:hypothetical protein